MIWQWVFLGNTLQGWGVALLLALCLSGAATILRRILVHRLGARAEESKNRVDDLVTELARRARLPLLAALALYVGSLVLVLPVQVGVWVRTLALTALLIQAAIWGDAAISLWLVHYQERNLVSNAGRVTTVKAGAFVLRLALFSLVALVALDNIPGVQVTALLASLGVGGIAVALAVQNILADLFASLSIALDQPFVIGDFIVVDDCSGSVEHIGLKTTRLRSLSGEQIVFSNSDLLKSRIRNYKRMSERRVVFSLGVTYQTPHEKLAAIPAMIREIIEAQPQARFDRAHFKEYGDFSLNFEVVYYMADPNYTLYMDVRQAINLAIFRRFAEEGIDFAYPTQTLFIHKTAGEPHP